MSGLWFLLIVALLIGAYGRVFDLGASPLAVDEYYMAQSVRNILQRGLPIFDCGGYYTRGLLHQYVAAALQIVGISAEVALRIISVLSNIAVLPALYLIGNKLGGRSVGIVALIFFSLSIWEIEFSRFGRMYAPFQAVFAWYLWFLIQAIQGNQRMYYAGIVLSVASLAIYEASVILLVVNFLPLFSRKIRATPAWVFATVSLLAGYLFLSQNFREIGADNALPQGYSPPLPGANEWTLPIDKPLIFIDNFGPAFIILIAVIALAVIWRTVGKQRLNTPSQRGQTPAAITTIWICVAIIGPVLNLFGLVLVIGLIFWLWDWIGFRDPLQRKDRIVITWFFSSLALWSMYIWLVPGATDEPHFSLKGLVQIMFLYPDLYSEVAYRWFRSMPLATAIMSGTIVAGVILAKTGRWEGKDGNLYLFIVGLLIALALIATVLPQPHKSIRYTFFLYPAVLLSASSALVVLTRYFSRSPQVQMFVVLVLTLGFCIVSEDVNVSYVRNIATDQVLFRTNLSKWEQDLVYRRWDYESPAAYVNQRINVDEKVLTTSQSVPFYLNKLDYFYRNESGSEFLPIAACGGTRELWSNAELVHKQDRLDSLIEGHSGALWLVLRSADRDEASPEERNIALEHSDKVKYFSRDGRLSVFYLPKNDERANQNQRIQ